MHGTELQGITTMLSTIPKMIEAMAKTPAPAGEIHLAVLVLQTPAPVISRRLDTDSAMITSVAGITQDASHRRARTAAGTQSRPRSLRSCAAIFREASAGTATNATTSTTATLSRPIGLSSPAAFSKEARAGEARDATSNTTPKSPTSPSRKAWAAAP